MSTTLNCQNPEHGYSSGKGDSWFVAYYDYSLADLEDPSSGLTGCHYDFQESFYTRIWRTLHVFDTSSIPSDAVISNVSLAVHMTYKFIVADPSRDALVDVLRASNPPVVGADEATIGIFLRENCTLTLGTIYVPKGGSDTYTVNLGDAGCASIAKGAGARTGLAYRIREDRSAVDLPTCPSRAGVRIDNQPTLTITYGTADDLTVVTLNPTGVTTTSVTMNGEITAGAATKRGFDYGEVSGALADEWYEEGTFGTGTFEKEITGLTPGQNFCYKAKACE